MADHVDNQPGDRLLPATARDWEELAHLCAESFPTSIRWRCARLAKRWWLATLSDPSAETWLIRRGSDLVAFLVLVSDEAAWAANSSARDSSTLTRVFCAMGAPHILLARYRESRLERRRAQAAAPLSFEVAAPAVVPLAERIWLELAAVSPRYRRQGYYKQLVTHSEQRARALGRRYVQGSVAVANPGPIVALGHIGYKVVAATKGRFIYRKDLRASI